MSENTNTFTSMLPNYKNVDAQKKKIVFKKLAKKLKEYVECPNPIKKK